MNNEKVVQDAIQNALVAYFSGEKRSLTLHGPSNRSQGFGIRDYCADLIAVLDNAQVILLEVKIKESSGKLRSFDKEQHGKLVDYEDIGVPVAYAYNSVAANNISHYIDPQPENWAIETLMQIIRATPRILPGETPKDGHGSLWDWLSSSADDKAHEIFGKVLGTWRSAPNLRNGRMVIIYAAKDNVISFLDDKELKTVSDFLNRKTINIKNQKKVLDIIKASNDVQNRILKLNNSPTGKK